MDVAFFHIAAQGSDLLLYLGKDAVQVFGFRVHIHGLDQLAVFGQNGTFRSHLGIQAVGSTGSFHSCFLPGDGISSGIGTAAGGQGEDQQHSQKYG